MDEAFVYEMRVEGFLADRGSEWFDGLAIRREPSGQTVLRGRLADQAALHGVLARIRDLNLGIVSVTRQSPVQPSDSDD